MKDLRHFNTLFSIFKELRLIYERVTPPGDQNRETMTESELRERMTNMNMVEFVNLKIRPEEMNMLLQMCSNDPRKLGVFLFFNTKDFRKMRRRAERKIAQESSASRRDELRQQVGRGRTSELAEARQRHRAEVEEGRITENIEIYEREVERILEEQIEQNPTYALIDRMIRDSATASNEQELTNVTNMYTEAFLLEGYAVEASRRRMENLSGQHFQALKQLGILTDREIRTFRENMNAEAINNKIKQVTHGMLDLDTLGLVPIATIAKVATGNIFTTVKNVLTNTRNFLRLAGLGNVKIYQSASEIMGEDVSIGLLVDFNDKTLSWLMQHTNRFAELKRTDPNHPVLQSQKIKGMLALREKFSEVIDRYGDERLSQMLNTQLDNYLRTRNLTPEQNRDVRKKIRERLGDLSANTLTIHQLLKLFFDIDTMRSDSTAAMGSLLGSISNGAKLLAAPAATASTMAAIGGQVTQLQKGMSTMLSGAKWTSQRFLRIGRFGCFAAIPALEMYNVASGNSKPRESVYNIIEGMSAFVPVIGPFISAAFDLKAYLTGESLAGKQLSEEQKSWRFKMMFISLIPGIGLLAKAGKMKKATTLTTSLASSLGRVAGWGGLAVGGAFGIGAYTFGAKKTFDTMTGAAIGAVKTTANVGARMFGASSENPDFQNTINSIIRDVVGRDVSVRQRQARQQAVEAVSTQARAMGNRARETANRAQRTLREGARGVANRVRRRAAREVDNRTGGLLGGATREILGGGEENR